MATKTKEKKTKIIPRGKYILVLPDSADSRENENGLIIPSTIEQEQKAFGKVEAVGSEIKDIKIGDRCVYGAYAGESIKQREDGKEVERKLLFDDDVIAFLR
jgi:co-chaperonin GroES (HSP10)